MTVLVLAMAVELLGRDSRLVRHLYGEANRASVHNEYERALRIYDRILVEYGEFFDAYYRKARVLEEMGRLDEAVETCRTGIAIQAEGGRPGGEYAPSPAEFHGQLGALLYDLGEFEESLVAFEASRPSPLYDYCDLAECLVVLYHLKEARSLYEAQSELDWRGKGGYEALRVVARHDFRGSQRERALEVADMLIDTSPPGRLAWAYGRRARALELLGQHEAARDAYSEAMLRSPAYRAYRVGYERVSALLEIDAPATPR